MVVYASEGQLPPGTYLGDCAVSGGTLRGYLQEALGLYGGKLCIRIAPVYMDFPLPCPSGVGRSLSADEAQALRQGAPCLFSPELGTNYFTRVIQGQAHVVLLDSPETLTQKFDLCQSLGVSMALVEDPALRRQLSG